MLIEELQCLKHLNVLEITLRSVTGFQKFSNTPKLLKSTHTLNISFVQRAKSLDISSFAQTETLEFLLMMNCDFKELNIDSIGSRNNLLGSATVTDRSFSSIKAVTVSYCDHLQDLTCLVLMPNLRNLMVRKCKGMRAIISGEKLDEVGGKGKKLHEFSCLVILRLVELPKLECIYPSSTLPLRFLSEFAVVKCPRLKKLPLGYNGVCGCQIQLEARKKWWNAVEWEDDAIKAALLPCFKLKLH